MNQILLTMSQAAEQCGVSKSTIARKRKQGEFPNSQQKEDGSYRIPVEDLIASGLLDKVVSQGASESIAGVSNNTEGDAVALQEMRHELDLMKQQLIAKDAEMQRMQQLIDTQNISIESLRTAVRALEAPKENTKPTTPQDQPLIEETEASKAVAPWWKKLFQR